MRRFIIILIIICFALPAKASLSGAFLENGCDAAPYSFGRAYVAYEGGISSLQVNPAGLLSLKDPEVISTYATVYEVPYQSISYGRPLFGGVLGFSVLYAGIQGIPETSLDSFGRPVMSGLPFGYGAYSILLAYSRQAGGLNLGADLKYIKEDLKDSSAQGLGVDIGAQVKLRPYLFLGACLKNLIRPDMSWTTGSRDPLSPSLALGCALQMFSGRLAVNLDYELDQERYGKHLLGAEFRGFKPLMIRAGLQGSDMRFGLGLNVANFDLDLAYGQESEDYLENIYKLTLGFKL